MKELCHEPDGSLDDASASPFVDDISYVSGVSSRPLLGITIGDAFDNADAAMGRSDRAGGPTPGHTLELS